VLRRGARDPTTLREDVALRVLKGDRIEIGALALQASTGEFLVVMRER
jgi:hypothetical protein